MTFFIEDKLEVFLNLREQNEYEFEYEVFDFLVQIKRVNNDIFIYVKLNKIKGYKDVNMEWESSIINKNNNSCQKSKQIYTNDNYLNNENTWGRKFIEQSKLSTYVVNGMIKFQIKIISCNFKHNESKIIQAIYEKLYGLEDHYLIKYDKTIELLTKNNTILETQIDKLDKTNIDLQNKNDQLTRNNITLQDKCNLLTALSNSSNNVNPEEIANQDNSNIIPVNIINPIIQQIKPINIIEVINDISIENIDLGIL
jgi:hypothetical protein